MRLRFILLLVLSLGLYHWHFNTDTARLRPRCHVTVSWPVVLDDLVPQALDELEFHSGITWERVDRNANIRLQMGTLPMGVSGQASTAHTGPYIRNVVITVPARQIPEYSTVLHELGHAYGVEHNDNPNSYLHPYGYDGQHITAQDEQVLAAVGGRCY